MEHQVGSRGGTARSEPVARNDETVRHDIDSPVRAGEILQILPMHGGAVTIQQPCPRQHPRPRIHRPHRAEPPRNTAQTRDQRAGGDLGLVVASNDDQRLGPVRC